MQVAAKSTSRVAVRASRPTPVGLFRAGRQAVRAYDEKVGRFGCTELRAGGDRVRDSPRDFPPYRSSTSSPSTATPSLLASRPPSPAPPLLCPSCPTCPPTAPLWPPSCAVLRLAWLTATGSWAPSFRCAGDPPMAWKGGGGDLRAPAVVTHGSSAGV